MVTLTLCGEIIYIGNTQKCRTAFNDMDKRGRIWLEEEFRLIGLADTPVVEKAVKMKMENKRLVFTESNFDSFLD